MHRTQSHYELSMNTKRYSSPAPVEYDLSLRPLPTYMKKFLIIAGIITIALTTATVSHASPSAVRTSKAYMDWIQ